MAASMGVGQEGCRGGSVVGRVVAGGVVCAVALLALACGARDDPLGPGDLEPLDPPASSSGSTVGPGGGCALCDGRVECNHCYIQGEETTYRCPPGLQPPESGCLYLDEWHRDQSGALYTCYYCP